MALRNLRIAPNLLHKTGQLFWTSIWSRIVWHNHSSVGACLFQIWGSSRHSSRLGTAFLVEEVLSDQVGPSFGACLGFERSLFELDRLCTRAAISGKSFSCPWKMNQFFENIKNDVTQWFVFWTISPSFIQKNQMFLAHRVQKQLAINAHTCRI